MLSKVTRLVTSNTCTTVQSGTIGIEADRRRSNTQHSQSNDWLAATNHDRAQCAAVVGVGDGTIAQLACGIPTLRVDALLIGRDVDKARSEFNADGRLFVGGEGVAREPRQQIRFADTAVADLQGQQRVSNGRKF